MSYDPNDYPPVRLALARLRKHQDPDPDPVPNYPSECDGDICQMCEPAGCPHDYTSQTKNN